MLINNAGYGIKTSFHETSIEDEEAFIRVLGTSVIMLTKLFIPKMLENGGGKIMIVSSVAALTPPSAIQPLYGPIKTFMNRFSDVININYKHKGISSTAVCPGFTTTGFHTASGVQEEMDRVPKFMVFPASRIANEGVRLNHCYVTNSICTPSRAAILTGTYNHVNCVTTLNTPIDNRLPNVAKHLQYGGYQTAIIGKWHLGEGKEHEPTGFDYWSVFKA